MKTKVFFLIASVAILFFAACKKENAAAPQVTFSNNVTQGIADANGEYTLTGHISSQVSLEKVTLTKEGESTPFIIDDSNAKNKNQFDYSYLITGITTTTTIWMDVYSQNGTKTSSKFIINKN